MPDEDYKAPIGISKEQWVNLLKDEKIITEKYLELLKALYSCEGCKARASQLATLLHKDHPNALNFLFKNVGQRILVQPR